MGERRFGGQLPADITGHSCLLDSNFMLEFFFCQLISVLIKK